MRSRKLAVFASIAAGVAGVLGAHALDYLVVLPNGVHRHELLMRTGHGYWPHAVAIGLVAGVLASLASFGAGMFSARGRTSFVGDALTLALVQSGAFLALEAIERIGSGAFATELLGPLLILGIALQVVVALAVAFVVRLLARAGEIVATLFARRVPRAVYRTPRSFETQIVRHSFASAPIVRRGPPFVAAF